MQFRFYTDAGDVPEHELAEALSDYEQEVGITAFGQAFDSIHPEAISTEDQARRLSELLHCDPPARFERA